MANEDQQLEQTVDGSQENLPADKTTQEEVNWEEKFKQNEASWNKKWSEKDRHFNENAEKLRAFEKHSPTLEKITEILSQRKAAEEAESVKNGDVGFLRAEMEQRLKEMVDQKVAPLEEQRQIAEQQLEVSNIQTALTKTFTGNEKYGDYAKAILIETLNKEGESAFWALVKDNAKVLKLAKADWLDDQEKQTTEKQTNRKENALNHRKTMAPASRNGVSADNRASNAYKNMSIEELEKEWIKAGGSPINIK